MQKIRTDEFVALAKIHPVLDVRSPGEYRHAHIPGACNLPLFSDEERKAVGTIYKQEGRESAIKTGLDYFGLKMRKMVEQVEDIIQAYMVLNERSVTENCALVHCWRGGMRSSGVAWLLDLYGFKVYTLAGGYKSYRKWALQQFDQPYRFNVLGGYTGSGKTQILKELSKENYPVIDLESIARHKGSAFGALGEPMQPTQEMFENELAAALHPLNISPGQPIWIEDESQRIGQVTLPNTLFKTMQQSPLYFLDIPFDERLNNITEAYGKFRKEDLAAAIMRIKKRLGGLNTKNAINYLVEDNYKESFRILLGYYDKYYERSLKVRDNNGRQLSTIQCEHIDAMINSKKLANKMNN
jgi:tRNA 2-selenouridine synthase